MNELRLLLLLLPDSAAHESQGFVCSNTHIGYLNGGWGAEGRNLEVDFQVEMN